jgi:hypothetical protein
MRWHIRRFQNKDGSLTDEGRKRYGVGSERSKSDTGLGKTNTNNRKPGIGVPLAVAATAGLTASTVSATKAALNDGTDSADNGSKKQKKQKNQDTTKVLNQGIEGIRQYRNAGVVQDNNQNQNRYNTRKTLSQAEMDALSDKELQSLVSRLNLETNYSRLTQEPAAVDKVDAGLQRVQAILAIAGTSVTLATAGVQLGKAISKRMH